MGPAQGAHEHQSAGIAVGGCAGGAGQGPDRHHTSSRRDRCRQPGVPRWDLRLAGGHNLAEMRCDRQRRQQRHAGMLRAMPRLHRQRHPHFRRRSTEGGMPEDDGWCVGAGRESEDHRRVQPPMQPCDPYRRADDPRNGDRRGREDAPLLLSLLSGTGGFRRAGDHRVLLHIHRGVPLPQQEGGGDRGGRDYKVP